MKKQTLVIILVATFLLASLTNTYAAAPLPFGGVVTMIQPCNTGLLVYVLTPLTGVVPFMWLTGELPFLSYIPPHPGQWLLGLTAAVPVPCVLGTVPYGAGLPILMHGSSL
ncbi:MAG: hypothetical protein A3C79_02975 [Candidatus Taylorbacteria bacterium RIFCSPHIGHO2_02_FULL_45_28]|uniref:Uncharacterized protein n=1 Tax=Candidatus Taylorbacteria bacterium RIFCSPHIGHO2_12_FULL_45_16 TaxID=1802315 RepID=A0A1G2N360_9BACT|nr:MAG: hypothetical protein A2830_00695 [Candidatus Taylorbacteria bacterium RIFCSPHIGHO2_01_FULL_44_110]OHA24924.1 MAG: hypothetical protein A3C79_02975 [Candidatus Taylorbacteria bacterium RIFCSPHIGHO2_02_FULL_45_28]OHA29742.1 MAG: hypothetical protein A3F51_03390 [Candidatus Taylorbacteria bacterium RIFCSPHIGHO2_12_FULL_45_16]OHA32686.1 MAG: hypothetical protein A3A23_00260 [Candidatus Taylorbacteria bacterium RIFCSPLOWO2_01_FULL_45_59]OHA38841.1 MAG: hypothetical protein A3I98_01700 [Candi